MATSAIEGVLMPGLLALAPNSRNAGITVYKTGYHAPRNWLKANHPNDYSIQLDIDQQGPGDEGAGADWSFDDARERSDFRTIAKFSNRLYQAGKNHDPRAYPLREFYGNIDLDRDVEGWSFYRDRPGSSDSSHLWHIHFSVWRKYINDPSAMRSILSILADEQEEENMPTSREVWQDDGTVNNVGFAPGSEGRYVSGSDALQSILQRVLQVKSDVGTLENHTNAEFAAVSNQLKALNAQIAEIKELLTGEMPTP